MTLENRNFPTDLIVLSISEFDVILGIDWLTKYRAILDCGSKSTTFTMPREMSFKFQCEPTSNVSSCDREYKSKEKSCIHFDCPGF